MVFEAVLSNLWCRRLRGKCNVAGARDRAKGTVHQAGVPDDDEQRRPPHAGGATVDTMKADVFLSPSDLEALARRALLAHGASPAQAEALAASGAAAEVDGVASHGLAYVPVYCEHPCCGKVNPEAVPTVTVSGNVIRVDADAGFAHLPVRMGFERLVPLARQLGAAVMAVTQSYNCGGACLPHRGPGKAGAGCIRADQCADIDRPVGRCRACARHQSVVAGGAGRYWRRQLRHRSEFVGGSEKRGNQALPGGSAFTRRLGARLRRAAYQQRGGRARGRHHGSRRRL